MRPVNGNACEAGRNPGEKGGKKVTKENPHKARQVRRDIDTSEEESQSDESPAKAGKPVPTMKSKQPSDKKDKEVRVVPNSTSYLPSGSADPRFRSSGRRKLFQSKVKKEKEVGVQGSHRRREGDLHGNHPELLALRRTQLEKEREAVRPRLNPVKLIEQARAAHGHLHVKVEDKKDARILAAVLRENPWIQSLKLACNFGGRSGGMFSAPPLSRLLAVPDLALNSPEHPNGDAFRNILDACTNIRNLNVTGCCLTEENWFSLADTLRSHLHIRHLEIGGGDDLSQRAAASLSQALSSGAETLREFVADGLFIDRLSLEALLIGLNQHGNFTLIKLQNLREELATERNWEVETLFQLCASNKHLKHLSLAGTLCKNTHAANDESFMDYLGNSWGWRPNSSDASAFNRHQSLRVLDLSGCRLSESDMKALVFQTVGHQALLSVRIQGNQISDEDRTELKEVTKDNVEKLAKRAAAAFDLLIANADNDFDVWPPELIEVLVENAPPEALPDIAAVIDSGSTASGGEQDAAKKDSGSRA